MRIADFVTFAKRIEGIPASHIRPAHADGDDGDAFRLFHDRIVDRVRRAGRELIAVGHDLVALDHCCFHASPGGGQHLGSMDLKFTQIGIRAEHEDACVPGVTALRQHGAGGFGVGLFDEMFHPLHARSEAHTSELKSLMRISSAVYSLQKKKHKTTDYTRSAIRTATTCTNTHAPTAS